MSLRQAWGITRETRSMRATSPRFSFAVRVRDSAPDRVRARRPALPLRMSLALARKYRPKRFADVAVQSHVSTTLKGAIARGRVAHGYLLCGPRGVGKTTLARVLAMALNCERRGDPALDGEPCGECASCRRIWSGSASLDVVEIDAASNRGVDDARELRERAMYAPSGDDRYKVYIVDEAHMLTREAWNALLKILEEPPPRVVFVFATTEPQKIAQAAAPVLSRAAALRLQAHRPGRDSRPARRTCSTRGEDQRRARSARGDRARRRRLDARRAQPHRSGALDGRRPRDRRARARRARPRARRRVHRDARPHRRPSRGRRLSGRRAAGRSRRRLRRLSHRARRHAARAAHRRARRRRRPTSPSARARRSRRGATGSPRPICCACCRRSASSSRASARAGSSNCSSRRCSFASRCSIARSSSRTCLRSIGGGGASAAAAARRDVRAVGASAAPSARRGADAAAAPAPSASERRASSTRRRRRVRAGATHRSRAAGRAAPCSRGSRSPSRRRRRRRRPASRRSI